MHEHTHTHTHARARARSVVGCLILQRMRSPYKSPEPLKFSPTPQPPTPHLLLPGVGQHRAVHIADLPSLVGQHRAVHIADLPSLVGQHRAVHIADLPSLVGQHRAVHIADLPSLVGQHRAVHIADLSCVKFCLLMIYRLPLFSFCEGLL